MTLADEIYEKICSLTLKRTQEIFDGACKEYLEKNTGNAKAPSIDQQYVPKKLTEANYHRKMVSFFSSNLGGFKKKWLVYFVLQKLLNEAISDEALPELKYIVPGATDKWSSRIRDLKDAVINNQPNEVKALMDIGADVVSLDMINASIAGLALSLKNNNCFDVMISHPAFLFSFESEKEVLHFFITALDAGKADQIKNVIERAKKTENNIFLDLVNKTLTDHQLLGMIHATNSRQIFSELGLRIPQTISYPMSFSDEVKFEELPVIHGDVTLNKKINTTNNGNANIYEGTWKNKTVAVKLLRPNAKSQETNLFQSEINIHSKLEHLNILTFFKSYKTPNYLFFVMELAQCGSLYDHILKADYNDIMAIQWLIQTAAALQHLHEMKFIHCDLKPNNILITADNQLAKLCDFGLSLSMSDIYKEVRGTPSYFAPEMFASIYQPTAPAIDIYAFGLLAYETLLKITSWRYEVINITHQTNTFFYAIKAGVRPPQNKLSLERYQLMLDCLQENSIKRPSTKDIALRLK